MKTGFFSIAVIALLQLAIAQPHGNVTRKSIIDHDTDLLPKVSVIDTSADRQLLPMLSMLQSMSLKSLSMWTNRVILFLPRPFLEVRRHPR